MQQKRSIMIVANCGISLDQKWQRMLKTDKTDSQHLKVSSAGYSATLQ